MSHKHTIEGTRRKSQEEIDNYEDNYEKSFDGQVKPVKKLTIKEILAQRKKKQ